MDHVPKGFTLKAGAAGLDWGGTELGPQSGDLMHYQLQGGDPYLKLLKDALATTSVAPPDPPKPK